LLCCVQYTTLSQHDTVLISERIGNVIDDYERCYFNLFPEVEGFESACIYQNSNKSFSLVISLERTNGGRDSTIIITDTLLKDLAFYVDNFEKIFINNSLDIQIRSHNFWSIAKPYQRYLPPDEIVWTDYWENKHSGYLLFCRGDYFLVLPKNDVYDWRNFKYNVQFIKSNHVEFIGANHVEGNIEVIRGIILKSYDLSFRDDLYGSECSIPSELKRYIELRQSKNADTNINRLPKQIVETFKLSLTGRLSPTRFFFEDSYSVSTYKSYGDLVNEDVFITSNTAEYFTLGLFLTLNEPLSYAFDFTWGFSDRESDTGFIFDYTNFDMYLKYRFLGETIDWSFIGDVDMTLNLGLCWSIINADINSFVTDYYEPDYEGEPYDLNIDGLSVFGLFTSYSLSFSFSKNVSVEFGFGFRWIPYDVKIFNELYFNRYGRSYYQVSDVINFSNVFGSIGVMYNIYIPK
jgi:hypothetical protein